MAQELATEAAEQTLLAAIDRNTLTPLVRSAVNSETVEVIDWDVEQLHGGFGLASAIYRVAGQARDRDRDPDNDRVRIVPWSLILKAVYPVQGNTQVTDSHYYKREVRAYQSGWLDDLPGGLVAPRCFGAVEHPDGACSLWLEEVSDDIGPRWPLEHYGMVARHVGQFNGACLVNGELPSWQWLSSGWLRGFIAVSESTIPLLRASLDHPLVRRWQPGNAIDRFFHLWEERGRFFDALDRLPQTLCHLDLFRRNLFARETGMANIRPWWWIGHLWAGAQSEKNSSPSF